MPLLPVAAREARIIARGRLIYGWRLLIAGVGLVLIPAVLWSDPSRPSQGPPLFIVLSTLAFIYAVFGGVLQTADTLSEEKRENTLGLLFLTDLKARDVITGKLLASTATTFFGLLAIMPLLAIPVLLGGVSSTQVLQMSASLLNTLFLSISWGLLISTLFRQAWVTISMSLLVMLFIHLGIVQLGGWLSVVGGESILLFSPLVGHLISVRPGALSPVEFWECLAVNHVMAWLNILLTAILLPQAWKEIPRSKRREAWWGRMQWLRFGGAKTRAKFRKRLLNANPLYWLSGREQVSSAGLMTGLMLIVFTSLAGEWVGIVIGLILMHAVILVRMASAASHSLAEDRKSGALELLLATSLSVREVLRGRWMALGRQFMGPILIVMCWHFFTLAWISMVDAGAANNILLVFAIPAAVLAWIATGWCGMWLGLRARHPVAAIWGTIAAVLFGPWLVMTALFGGLAFFDVLPQPQSAWTSSFMPMATVGPGRMWRSSLWENTALLSGGIFLWCLYLWALAVWCAGRIRRHFREAATDRFSDTQPYDWTRMRQACVRFAAAVVVLVALVFGWRAWVNFRGERSYRNALAAFPNFKLEDPERPMYPAEQNLGRWDFLANIHDDQTRFVYRPGQKVSLHQQVLYGFQGGESLNNWRSGQMVDFKAKSTAPAERAAAFLKRYQSLEPELQRLREAARERPYLQFPPQPVPPSWQTQMMFGGGAPPSTALQGLIQYLGVISTARVATGENPIEDVLLTVRLAASLTNEPADLELLSQMVRLSVQPIYEGMLAHRWTDADLRAMQKAFEGIDFFQSFHEWRLQRARDFLAGRIKVNPTAAPGFIPGGTGPGFVIAGQATVREELPGKINQRKADMIHYALGQLPKAADGKTHRVWLAGTMFWSIERDFQFNLFRNEANQVVNEVAHGQTAVDQVNVACALERFRLARGNYPLDLKELIPAFIRKIPNDVITGELPKYRSDENRTGYVLYSLGFDQRDDGGKPSPYPPGDWAWIGRKTGP